MGRWLFLNPSAAVAVGSAEFELGSELRPARRPITSAAAGAATWRRRWWWDFTAFF
jgi:hypothetical protein